MLTTPREVITRIESCGLGVGWGGEHSILRLLFLPSFETLFHEHVKSLIPFLLGMNWISHFYSNYYQASQMRNLILVPR